MEEWVDIEGYEGLYEISNSGSIRSKASGKLIKGELSNTGYPRVGLRKDGKAQKFSRHRLVALHFVPNEDPELKQVVHHVDGIKTNPQADNLRWVTQAENLRAAYDATAHKHCMKQIVVEFQTGTGFLFANQSEAADFFGVSRPLISYWMSNKKKSYKRHNIRKIFYSAS